MSKHSVSASVIKARLEELRAEIRAECISYGEIAELQELAEHIDPGDAELLQWAGVPEFERKCAAGCGALLMEDEPDGPCYECSERGA